MPTTLTTQAVEESSYAITLAFTDEDGNAVAPATLVWSLITEDGTYVNSRQDVAVATPTSSETILLSGADLEILADRDVEDRYLIIEGTYDSSLGAGLPLNDEIKFEIVNIKKVT